MKAPFVAVIALAVGIHSHACGEISVHAEARHITPTNSGHDIQLEFKVTNLRPTPVNFIQLGDTHSSTMGGFIVLLKAGDARTVHHLSTTSVTVQGEDVIPNSTPCQP